MYKSLVVRKRDLRREAAIQAETSKDKIKQDLLASEILTA